MIKHVQQLIHLMFNSSYYFLKFICFKMFGSVCWENNPHISIIYSLIWHEIFLWVTNRWITMLKIFLCLTFLSVLRRASSEKARIGIEFYFRFYLISLKLLGITWCLELSFLRRIFIVVFKICDILRFSSIHSTMGLLRWNETFVESSNTYYSSWKYSFILFELYSSSKFGCRFSYFSRFPFIR